MVEGVVEDAAARYEAARDRAVAARAAWEDQGGPLIIVHVNGLEGVHPLFKALNEAEAHADKMMKSLNDARKRHRGPQPSAVIKTGIGKSPAAKLRAVK